MKLPDLDARFAAAKKMVLEAGEIAMASFRKPEMLGLRSKGLHDPVTEADLAIDHRLRQIIAEYFPEDGILSEEIGGSNARNLWVIDPIDGTQNFARGIGHFAISIAFVSQGRCEIGVVYNPATGEIFSAKRGCGAFCHDERLAVREPAGPEDAIIDAGYSTKLPVADYIALLGRLTAAEFGFVQNGSAAMGLAHVAAGRLDGYCELLLQSWDVMAGALLIEEAGGWVSSFSANDDLTQGKAILASTPSLQARLIEITGIGAGA
ncbi:inositol monophosphatase family protein [Brucella rhizosphaerae]|uniref:Inositol-1-monophosphatase n=1 Tax=Brucella rhizosphaerae TaxID=571254 RepID=A0A256FXY5_9HYPH|nr:inositol monophosphatase [Brucella rhizosphaerae]OYR19618.1 inositol monophosphatase family protein [Brucella rhizosphaerae]